MYQIDRRQRGFVERSVPYARGGVAGLGAVPQLQRVQPIATTTAASISNAIRVPLAIQQPVRSTATTTPTTTTPTIPLIGFGPMGAQPASEDVPVTVDQATQSTSEVLYGGGGIEPMQMPVVPTDQIRELLGTAEQDAQTMAAELERTNPWLLAAVGIAGAMVGFVLLRMAR
jgi:hypothetical protein